MSRFQRFPWSFVKPHSAGGLQRSFKTPNLVLPSESPSQRYFCSATYVKQTSMIDPSTIPPELKVYEAPNGFVHVELSRPKQLNSLTPSMICALAEWLPALERDDRCKGLLLTGAGERAFCAGGDVRAAADMNAHGPSVKSFFGNEYILNYRIGAFKKPVVAILNGICMGGGAGVSIHGSYRIGTEKTLFAMPETTIGLFPDVGMGAVLSRLPGGLGLYFGLTSHRLNVVDTMLTGLTTHFVPVKQLEELKESIFSVDLTKFTSLFDAVESVLRKHTANCYSSYEELLESHKLPGPTLSSSDCVNIAKYFGNGMASSMKELWQNLSSDAASNPFCEHTLNILKKKCPLSMAVWFKFHRLAERDPQFSLWDALIIDFKLVQSFILYDVNFAEGVRAQLKDKDGNPKWVPATVPELTDEQVDRMFDDRRLSGLEEMFNQADGRQS